MISQDPSRLVTPVQAGVDRKLARSSSDASFRWHDDWGKGEHMPLEIVREALEAMAAHAARAAPQEACGLLLGEAERIVEAKPCANVHSTPQTHFELDPQALIEAHRADRAGGPELIGYYHSHPSGPPEPSATDRAQAAGDGKVWAIVAGGDVRMWRDDPHGFKPLSYTLAEA